MRYSWGSGKVMTAVVEVVAAGEVGVELDGSRAMCGKEL